MTAAARIIDSIRDLSADLLAHCRSMPLPRRLLMCKPDAFDVVDVKNPFMQGNIGRVDRAKAVAQWNALRQTFESVGAHVSLIDPVASCEDMVFCANQTLPGLNGANEQICLLSRMKHESRQREVPAFEGWFRDAGYRLEQLPSAVRFEGSGDAIWHPGRGLIWGGHGHRSDPAACETVARLFGVPVIRLRLVSDRFYHLDTALCAIDERTALYCPESFEPAGIELIRAIFVDPIECPRNEAEEGMACNATAIGGRHVIVQKGNARTCAILRERGFEVREVDTSEFMKSGGSVFCLKMYVF